MLGLSVRELRARCAAKGISTVGFTEKADFVSALEAAASTEPAAAEAPVCAQAQAQAS